jgi:limonene-1,2-epoxide hydrolase
VGGLLHLRTTPLASAADGARSVEATANRTINLFIAGLLRFGYRPRTRRIAKPCMETSSLSIPRIDQSFERLA